MLNGRRAEAFVAVLRTQGCSWARSSGCTMCGYINDAFPATIEELKKQVDKVLGEYRGEKVVKVYTSGSFLDENEVPSVLRHELLEGFKRAERVIIETRPEYITLNIVDELLSFGNVMVALGLESSKDKILKFCINKGFRREDYVSAAQKLNNAGIPLKTYVLLKPPFLSEVEAIEDAVSTAHFSSTFSAEVSINPVNVQANTLVEHLWKRGEYRPPWLWSIVEVLKRCKPLLAKCRVISIPTGGGTKRGAHNCGECDSVLLQRIVHFSLSQNLSALEGLECTCRQHWLRLCSLENFAQNTLDLERFV